jgi:uncharacterized protein
VDDLFAPPGTPWEHVSPGLATMRRVVLLGCCAVLLLTVAVLALLLDLPAWSLVLALAVAALVAGTGWPLIGRNAARWRYAEREEDLYITRGYLLRRLVVVPYGRMQYVDVQAGPLDRAFGVARVHLHTASPGTSAHIPGLPAAEAARLRDRLTSLGSVQAAGL